VLWKIEIANEGAVMEIESCHGLGAGGKKRKAERKNGNNAAVEHI